jgi:hypothetical protein
MADASRVVLREIRDELEAANARLESVEQRVLGLDRRQLETETRLASELVGVAKAVGGVRDLLRDRLDVRDRVEDHERRP